MPRTIGLIAGNGKLPAVLAEAVRARGERLVVIRTVTDGAAEFEGAVVHDIFAGRWGSVVEALKREAPERVYLAGKISREHLFAGGQFDERFQRVMASLTRRNDDAVIQGFVDDLAREGMVVGAQSDYLSHLLTGPGILGARRPSVEAWRDIVRGFEVAKAVAGLDVGQTVVVKGGAVLAVEAVDGTDAAIARGSALGRGGAVVVKVAKPHQDMRFDVPTVGLDTLQTLAKHQAAALVFEAEKTLFMEQEEAVSLADECGIALVSYKPGLESDVSP